MKRFTFIVMLASMVSLSFAQERVIERPPFIAWNTSALEIDRIILSDTATVFEVTGFSRPGTWIAIASSSRLKDNNGSIYPIRSAVGIQLDKQITMPESGQSSFRLIFAPVATSATVIDFGEGDEVQGPFHIWGIQLQNTALPPLVLPAEAVVHQPDMNATLPQPPFHYGKAVLTVKVPDYRKEMGEAMIFTNNSTLAMGAIERVKIGDDGVFRYETQTLTVAPGKLRLNNREFDYLLAPGQETEIIINFREISRKQSRHHRDSPSYGQGVYYNGYMAALQQEMATHPMNTTVGGDYEKILAAVDGMDIEGITNYLLTKHEEISRKIAEAPVSRACKQLWQAEADLSAADLICAANSIIVQADIIKKNLPREEMIKAMRTHRKELPASHFEVLKEKFPVINQPEALYAFKYNYFIMSSLRLKENLSQALGTQSGILFDNIANLEICNSLNSFTPLTTEQEATLTGLSSPAYMEQAQALNRKLLETTEKRKNRIADLSRIDIKDVSNEDLYTALVSQHRGKVVLIDIWATWCAPCRLANKEIKPLKEEWKDKDIVFLYVAGENSPEKLWQEMSAEISGIHYRLTRNQYNYLMESFNTSGVPTYIVVDKDGSVSRVLFGYPGLEEMKKELIKAGV